MVTIAVAKVSNNQVIAGIKPGKSLIYTNPTVFIAIDNIVTDSVVTAAKYINPSAIGHDHRRISKGHIVTDDIVIATIEQTNATAGVVICGITCDDRVGSRLQINALHILVFRSSITNIAHMVVRDGDVVRTVHVEALI